MLGGKVSTDCNILPDFIDIEMTYLLYSIRRKRMIVRRIGFRNSAIPDHYPVKLSTGHFAFPVLRMLLNFLYIKYSDVIAGSLGKILDEFIWREERGGGVGFFSRSLSPSLLSGRKLFPRNLKLSKFRKEFSVVKKSRYHLSV
jgi:hypothetical protein